MWLRWDGSMRHGGRRSGAGTFFEPTSMSIVLPFHEACEQRLLDRIWINVLPNSSRPRRESGKGGPMKKLFRIVLVVLAFALTAAADSGNRFKNSAPDPLASNDDGLFTPAQFEAVMAARPDPSGKIFVSRCRFAPFSSTTTLYAPFAGTQTADAIVGDTITFFLADGTKC